MLVSIRSVANYGIESIGIDVEVNIASKGFPSFDIVGLPSKAVAESRDRVKTAVINSDLEFPVKKITINLAPADLPKEGSFYDFPIAAGIIGHAVDVEIKDDCLFYGELSLDGTLRHTKGCLLVAIYAKEKGIRNLYVPKVCANEAALIEGVNVYGVSNLKEFIDHLVGTSPLKIHTLSVPTAAEESVFLYDMNNVLGQYQSKRALEIAAAGGHNVFLTGPPGGGKTLLAKAFSSILPPLNYNEGIEVTKIYSAAGYTRPNQTLILDRKVRSPHHTVSYAGMVGGGTIPRPGEVSLAHRGVLFLDELPEFPRHVLESLRQPIEDGEITISRSHGSVKYPCRFILLAASNPCPCGYFGHPSIECSCTQHQINRYSKRISGPLLDRIDLFVKVSPVKPEELAIKSKDTSKVLDRESSSTIKARVLRARNMQSKRFMSTKIHTNSEMSNLEIQKYVNLTDKAESLARLAVRKFDLSARSYFKLIKVSRTIADLADSEQILEPHISEALQYRKTS